MIWIYTRWAICIFLHASSQLKPLGIRKQLACIFNLSRGVNAAH